MRRRQSRSDGFTLVEMLVVLAIIAVLVGVITPTYKSVQKRAAWAQCVSNLDQIGLAIQQYKMDRRRYPASLYELAAAGYVNSNKLVACAEDEEDPSALTDVTTVAGRQTLTQSSYDVAPLYPGQSAPVVLWNYYGYQWTDADGDSQSDPGESEGIDSATTPTGPAGRQKHLANRNAPGDTIATHCIYHRRSLTEAPSADDSDVALRLDGSAEGIKPLEYDWVSQP